MNLNSKELFLFIVSTVYNVFPTVYRWFVDGSQWLTKKLWLSGSAVPRAVRHHCPATESAENRILESVSRWCIELCPEAVQSQTFAQLFLELCASFGPQQKARRIAFPSRCVAGAQDCAQSCPFATVPQNVPQAAPLVGFSNGNARGLCHFDINCSKPHLRKHILNVCLFFNQ